MSQAISGPLKGTKLDIIPTSNTTWKEWKEKHPDTQVLTTQTGYRRDYTRTPYTGYDESIKTYFPVNNESNSYHQKELVTGIEINGKSKAYPFAELSKSMSPISDRVGGESVKVTFDMENRVARIYDSSGNELPHYTTFWFAWYAFHPDTKVYKAH